MRTLIAISMLLLSTVLASAGENESPLSGIFDTRSGSATGRLITDVDPLSAFATKTDTQRALEEIARARKEWEEKVRGDSTLLSGSSTKNCPTWECAEKQRETDPNGFREAYQSNLPMGDLVEGM